MAYREFHYEKQYEAPDTSRAFEAQTQAVSNVFRALAEKQKQKQVASDQFQYDLDKGAFENDTMILGEVAKNVTDRAKSEYRGNGRLSPETQRLMVDGKTWQQQSQNQLTRAKELNASITGKNDIYYNPEPDLKLVKWATHGDNNDVDFRTRGERLAEAEKKLGGVDTFKYDLYRADYVKRQGQMSKEREFPMKNGSSKTIFDQATFWTPDGKPGVTDTHAIDFLESDRRVATFYDAKIARTLEQEITQMKNSGDSRAAWMKGLSDAEIKNELINNPSKNLINQKDYGVRVREAAKQDLQEADKVNNKVSYTALQSDENNSGGRWKNPNILITDSINGMAQEAKDVDGKMSTVKAYGPGGRIVQKSGRAVQIDTTNPVRTNIKTGLTTTKNKGSIRMNLTGYQLTPFKSTGAPFLLKGTTPEAMVEEINNIPLEYFDPNGKMKLRDNLQISMNGYVIDEAGVLNDVQDQLLDLSTKIKEATAKNDVEQLASLQNMEMNLNDLKEMVGAGDYDPQQLLLAGNKAGVRKIQNDMLIPADDSDLATIRNITGGFNLKDKSTWSEEMRIVDEAYRKRAEEAKAQGYGVKKDEKTEKPKTITPEEFNTQWAALKSGQKLVGPDGKTYTKK